MATVAELGVDIDATDRASRVITKIDALLKSLGSTTASPTVGPETAAAEAELAAIEKSLKAIDGETAKAKVDLDGAAAQAQILAIAQALAKIDGQVAEATADVDVDGLPELAALHGELEALNTIRPVIGIDVDTLRSLAELDALRAKLAALQNQDIDVDVDITRALVELDILEIKLLRATRDREIDIDVDWPSIDRIAAAATRASGQVTGLTTAIVALGPALVPITAVALAGLGALGAGLLAATAGVALFGGMAVSAFLPIIDTLKKMKVQQDAYDRALTSKQREAALEKQKALWETLDPAQQKVAEGMGRMLQAWGDLEAEMKPEIFALAGRAMDDLGKIIPRTEPLLHSMSAAFSNLLTSLENSLSSPAWQGFLTNMERVAGPITESLLRSLGNLITGIVGILNAFIPMSMSFTSGFEEMTAAFAKWGTDLDSNPGFKSFTEYVKREWPRIKGFIIDVWKALIDLVKVSAPIGADVVDAIGKFARGISALAESNPKLLEMAIRLAGLGFVIVNLLGPLSAVVASFRAAGTGIGFFTGVAKLLSVTLGISITALSAWVIAIIAIGAALVIAYQKVEWFRNAVNAFASWISSVLIKAWNSIGKWLGTEIDKWIEWWHQFDTQINEVVTRVKENLDTLGEAFTAVFGDIDISAFGDYLVTMLGNALQLAGDVAAAGMEILRGIFTVGLGLITLDWGTFRDGLVMIASGLSDLLLAPFTFLWNTLLNLFGVKQEELRGNWDKFWSDLAAGVSAVWDAIMAVLTGKVDVDWSGLWTRIKTIAQEAWDGFWNTLSNAQTGWDAMIAGLQEKLPDWESFWTDIKSKAKTAWDELWTAVKSAQTQWDEMVASLGDGETWTNFWNDLRSNTSITWSSMWEDLKTQTREAWESISQTTIDQLVNLEQINDTAATFVHDVFAALWTWLKESAIQLWQDFVTTAQEQLTSWEQVNDTAATFVHNVFAAFWTWLKSSASKAWQDFVTTVTKYTSDAKLTVQRMANDMISYLEALPGKALAAARSFGSSIIRGIREKIDEVGRAALDLAKAMTAPLPGSPAEIGPLSGQGYALLRARRMMDDIARGLGDTSAVQRATNDIADLMALEMAPREAYRAIAEGRSVTGDTGSTIIIEAGAVQVSVDGGDPEGARETFSDAAEELVELIDALQRR